MNKTMNKRLFTHLRVRFQFALMALIFLLSTKLSAQIQIQTNQPTARYKVGETVQFEVSSNLSGVVNYSISFDSRTTELESGSVTVAAGTPSTISYRLNEPGLVVCSINQGNFWAKAAAIFSPFEIDSYEAEPADFDAFWNQKKAELSAVSLDPQVTLHSSSSTSRTYKVNLANVGNRRVYGYITVPEGTGPFPALINMPAFGQGANLTSPAEFVSDVSQSISVALSIHDIDPQLSDPNAYQPNNIADRDEYYYKYGILGTIRMIDYLFTMDEFDGESVGLMGVSQGGGLAIIVAGLDDRVNLLVTSNPILAEHTGLKYDRPSGFPYYIRQSRDEVGTSEHEQQTMAAVKYYDAVYFAKRYDGPALAFISYEDETVPPATSFAAFNQTRGTKIVMHSLDLGHVHPPEYWNGRYDFIRRHFPATIHNPFQATTGYGANAGNSQSVQAGNAINLNGSVEFNDEALNNLPVKWAKVSGPGTVNFGNDEAANTTATFSEAGTYVLEFRADDLEKLNSEQKYYTLIDYVTIEVEEDTDVSVDLIPPTVTLAFLDFDDDGNILVEVGFNEEVIGLGLNDFDIENGDILGLTGSGREYFLIISPDGSGDVVVSIEEGAVSDIAGNENNNSDQINITIEAEETCVNVSWGGVISGNEAACGTFDASEIESVAAAAGGEGILEYRWQRSTLSPSGSWQNIPDSDQENFSPNTITQTTWFRRLSRRANCGDFQGISNVIKKEVSSGETMTMPAMDYCEAKGDHPWWQWIKKVKIGDFSNTSSKERYGDFTTQSIHLIRGNIYDVQLVPDFAWESYKEYWRVWIDFNQDGDFYDSGELIFSNKGEDIINGVLTIPRSVGTGITRLRVAMKNGGYANACERYTFGEVEDYTVFIANSAPVEYCEPRGENPHSQWIRRVTFEEINHVSEGDRYGDFTGLTATVSSGESYPITLKPGFSGSHFDEYWRVWIDFNQNGSFGDSGEMVFARHGEGNMSGDIAIPEYAAPGITRMRIAMQKDNYSNACETFELGEVEDYSLQIQECGEGLGANVVLNLWANRENSGAKINWITTTEYKNNHFVLERSIDGIRFEPIQRIESQNDTYLFPTSYVQLDAQPILGLNYYRIQQIYKNGAFKYSNVAALIFNTDQNDFSIFPNPVDEQLYLNLKPYEGQSATINLYNKLGQQIKSLLLETVPNYPIRMDLKGQTNGLYYLTVKVEGHRELSRKFVIGQMY